MSLSSTETELVSVSQCGKQLSYSLIFTEFVKHEPCEEEPTMYSIELITDNKEDLSLSTSKQVSERNKHIYIKAEHVVELVNRGVIRL